MSGQVSFDEWWRENREKEMLRSRIAWDEQNLKDFAHDVWDGALATRPAPVGDVVGLLGRLLCKVNRVTAWYRHHGRASIPTAALDALADYQIEVERVLESQERTA